MDENQDKPNTFADMEKKSATTSEAPQQKTEPLAASGEVNIEDFSDVAVGEKVKYVRPDLNGKEDVIEKFQVFSPDTNEAPRDAQSGPSKHWKVTMILTYESKNEDGVNNREYISGARCFQQRDGGASDTSFWYEGCATQSGALWELVATKLAVKPEELSPRQFVAFLNSKPKLTIAGVDYKNYGAAKGSPATVKKNMPGAFA